MSRPSSVTSETPAGNGQPSWMYHVGIHRGTLTSRDADEPKPAKSLQECRDWAERNRQSYASLGCQICFCYAMSPEGVRTTLIAGAPYY